MALHKPVELTLDRCIKCNICVTACPVMAVTDEFPGPKYEAPQAGRFRGSVQPLPDSSVDFCSGCRVCNMVCPTGVKIAEINARARRDMVAARVFSWRHRVRNNLLARPELLGRVAQPAAALANKGLHMRFGRVLVEKLLGIDRRAPLPTFAKRRFTHWIRQRSRRIAARKKIVYFHGCATEYYEPRVGKAAIRVLEANGFDVLVPRQTCCGLPLLSNGEFDAARDYYQENLRQLADFVRQGYVIVGTSTSCTLTLKEEAPELLDDFSEDANLVATHTYDLHEFLVEMLEAGELKPPTQAIPLTLAYHPPCQFRAHRVGKPSLEIMRLIPALQVVESDVACCGIAGTYGYKVEKYPVAMAVGEPLFEFVAKVGGPAVVCDSETCRWQLTHGTGIPAIHPVELLAMAYGLPVEGPLADLRDAI